MKQQFILIWVLCLLISCRNPTTVNSTQNVKIPIQSQKLVLSAEMIINEVAKGNAGFLVDEQAMAGEAKPTRLCTTTWSVKVPEGEVDWYLPANAVIDLGREHVLTSILLYDGDGTAGPVKLNYGTPFRWTNLLTDSLNNSNTWNEHKPANIRTRYLQISKETDADLREVVLNGYPVGTLPQLNTSAIPPRPPRPVKNNIGVNGYIDDPMDKVLVADIVREYHHWHYNEGGYTANYPGYPNNQIQWAPAIAGGKNFRSISGYPNDLKQWNPRYKDGLDFDVYYRQMKEAGILVFPCIQGNPPWLSGEKDKSSRHKPVPAGSDAANPASYGAHADFLFQYAARYGSTKVPDEKLKLAPNQERKSGLGYLEYYENWNEPDGWWGGRSDYFSPYEYAAMSSADYDGHESTMGKDKGIKNADRNAKLVMSGIAIPNVDYLRAMQFWFEHNRKDKKFVFDVLTVHHYCNAGGGQAVMSQGISPEQDDLKSLMQKITDFRDKYAPDKEVWMTEFGWDTNPVTPQSAPSKEVQGQWLVRAFLACLAGGMDRVAMFLLPDPNPNSKTQFSSCGLIGPRGNHAPKPSWFYVYTLRQQLTGLAYHDEVKATTNKVRIYRFKDPAGNRGVYVLWCPTSNGTVVKDYLLNLEGVSSKATLVTMQAGREQGITKKLTVTNGSVGVNVSERPVFVQVDRML
jgi:hypothetical protein